MENAFFYALTSLIWGSTWIAITFQLGPVAPEASIVYRFALAALVLGVFVLVRKLPMTYSWREHAFIALQGAFLFSFNYILVYLAEQRLTSGLVAIIFSTLIIMNVLLGALFLGNPIRPRVLAGGLLGVAGLVLVFSPEIAGFDFSGGRGLGLALSFVGVLSASIGNVIASRNQRSGLPVVQTNAIGMAYGTLITLVIALLRGVDFTFDSSPAYLASLAYLAVFGSVIAFGSYLTLIGRMGIDRAAYIGVVFPLVALALSTLFEGLAWNLVALLGVVLVVAGNVLALSRRRRAGATPQPAQA